MTRRVSLAALRSAAQVVREAGVCVTIEAPDGTLYRIAPEAQTSPLGATERDADECDKAFGVGSK